MKRKEDLAVPRQRRRIGVHYDNDAFGQFSESIARTLGTARFLVWQSFLIIVWIIYNFVLPDSWQFDPWDRGLVLLTLVLSLQASYAAPLILTEHKQKSTVALLNGLRLTPSFLPAKSPVSGCHSVTSSPQKICEIM